MDKDLLRYRRQFLLSRIAIASFSNWNRLSLAKGYVLYSHPDLEITFKEKSGVGIALLGYLFDPADPKKGNAEILNGLLEDSGTFEAFLESIKGYAGRYVFIYMNRDELHVMHDPLGLREVYYCASVNRIICGSQPNLIKKYADPAIDVTADPSIRDFYEKDMKKIRMGRLWVGDETYYEGIKHLLPNHYLKTRELRALRYWPRQNLEAVGLDEAVQRSCSFLRGTLLAASHRNDLMMAVTGGTDSRTLLAASREIRDRIYFFINKHRIMDDNHPDIRIPATMFQRIQTPFHIHSVEGDVDDEFRNIFLNNTFLSQERLLPAIYNIYYKQHSHRMNILGVGEIGRTFYGEEPQELDGYFLARSLKYKNSVYAVAQCQQWLDRTRPFAQKFGVNIMTLLLWEQLLGNWGVVGNSESDIAIEEFDPYNCHYLYETMLGVDKKYAKYGESILFREMIKNMWPELLEFPINPPKKKIDHIKRIFRRIGVYSIIKSLSYRWGRIQFNRWHARSGPRGR
jgi:hypothetical protein